MVGNGWPLPALPVLLRSDACGNSAEKNTEIGESKRYVAIPESPAAIQYGNAPVGETASAAMSTVAALIASTAPQPRILPRAMSRSLSGESSCKVSPARSDPNRFIVNGSDE